MSQTKVAVGMLNATGTPGSGNFLRGDGTWNTPAAGAMSLISSTDISNAATYNFTAMDASSYDSYGFLLQNVTPATDDVKPELRTSSNGGSSYDSGASDYGWMCENWGVYTNDVSDDSIHFVGSSAGTSYNVGSASLEDGMSGWIWLLSPHLAKCTMVNSTLTYANGTVYAVITTTAGMRWSQADVDAIQFYFSSGNIESGTINAYGLANA